MTAPAAALLLVGLLPAAVTGYAQAEVRFGIRAGATTSQSASEETFFEAEGARFGLALDEVKFGLQGGLFLQVRWERFALQPELLFNTSRRDYRLRDLTQPTIIETLVREAYHSVNLPLLVAYRWGPLRIQAGPVGEAYVGGASAFEEVAGITEDYPDVTLGYQAGVGLDIFKVLLDLKYQGGFADVGDHLTIAGDPISLNRLPASTVVSLGLAF